MTAIDPTFEPQPALATVAGTPFDQLASTARAVSARLRGLRGSYVISDISIVRSRDPSPDDSTVSDFIIATVGYAGVSEETLNDDLPAVTTRVGRCEYIEAMINGADCDVLSTVADLVEALPSGARVLDIAISEWAEPEQAGWRAAIYYATTPRT